MNISTFIIDKPKMVCMPSFQLFHLKSVDQLVQRLRSTYIILPPAA